MARTSVASRGAKAPFPPGILVDGQILRALDQKLIGIEPFERGCLEPATYDMRLGEMAAVSTGTGPINLKELRLLNIEPGAMAIVQTLEVIQLSPSVAGRIGPKTDLLRRGVFASAGPQIDPGFNGRLIVNLINLSPRSFTMAYGEPFLTIEFHKLSGTPTKAYQGSYQGRVELSRDELDVLSAYQGPTLAEIYKGFGELRSWSAQAGQILTLLQQIAVKPEGSVGRATLPLHINSLEPEPYELHRPIPVLVQAQAEDWIASFFDANLHASGGTEQEAFDNLRSLILDVLESLEGDDALGAESSRQLAVLRTFIKRRD